jgi:hypothetical protein
MPVATVARKSEIAGVIASTMLFRHDVLDMMINSQCF